MLHANYDDLKSDFCGYLEFHIKYLEFFRYLFLKFYEQGQKDEV